MLPRLCALRARYPELARTDCLIQVTLGGEIVRFTLHRESEQRTVTVRGHIPTNAPLALRTLAVDGLGVALLPDWLVEDDIAADRLRRVLPEWSSAPLAAWAIHRSELRGNQRLTAFLDTLELP